MGAKSLHYPLKKKMLKGVIWHQFLEIWDKVKKLSEIEQPLIKRFQTSFVDLEILATVM